jgi:hypothetical protein
MGVRVEIAQVYAEAGDLNGESADAAHRRKITGQKIIALGNAENESWGVELGYRYDESPIIWHESEPPAVDPLVYKPSTWPGARLPHVFLSDGVSIHAKLGKYFTLVALNGVDTMALEQAAASRGIPLEILTLDRPDLRPIYARNLLLVRPDQHVAWRGDELPENLDALFVKAIGAEI